MLNPTWDIPTVYYLMIRENYLRFSVNVVRLIVCFYVIHYFLLYCASKFSVKKTSESECLIRIYFFKICVTDCRKENV